MDIVGTQLNIISTQELIERAEGLGVRITLEIGRSDDGADFLVHAVGRHLLLPGKRQALGLVVVDVSSEESRLLGGATHEDAEIDARTQLAAIADRISFTRTSAPLRALGAQGKMQLDVIDRLH
ncbi:hypothetical protein [Eleftheria terrae]|uniref:hypothetical protein n=1 Tax=Eleftheria terrae TaxID=1597781 RepID=UPI00263B36C5|nr:hypothetical protein [Eleftheria terrae]WKB50538.1 hypothetical protein N7L95_00020 [Eleftheria terrae]